MDNILGYLFTLVLSMIMSGGFWVFAQKGVQATQDAVIAQQASMINNAAILYVQDHGSTLLSTATSSTPVSVTIPQLVCGGYLSQGYAAGVGCPAPAYPTSSMGVKNPLGQNWLLQVGQPVAGKLQAVVISTGGSPYTLKQSYRMVNVASQIGAMGGFVPYTNQAGDSTMNASNAQGIFGGWSMTPMTANGFINPGSGHFASMLAFRNGQYSNNFLYRVAVPGQPNLNTMTTPLIMNSPQTFGTACSPAGSVADDATGNYLVCQNTGTLGQVWTNWMLQPAATLADLSTCTAANDLQVALVASPNAGGSGPTLYACNTASSSAWQPIGVDANGNLNVPATLTAQNAVITNNATVTNNLTSTNGNIVASNGGISATNGWIGGKYLFANGTSPSANGMPSGASSVIMQDNSCPALGAFGTDSNGVLLSCQNSGFGSLIWSQLPRTAASGGSGCLPGQIARDASNNLYICN